MIRLETINRCNWRLELKVSEEQRNYVSDSMKLLARAYAYRDYRSNAFIIYNDSTPVGMALYYDSLERDAYVFSEFFIDEHYQNKGFGLEAAAQILDNMRADGKHHKVLLCFIEGNMNAQRMYEKLGFILTGERDGDEIMMEKFL